MTKIISMINDPVLKNGYYVYKDNIYTERSLIGDQMILEKDFTGKVSFYFHDEIFSKYDWTKEPNKDIHDMYRERALQLRDQYPYLILAYSGGTDSQQVLDVFLENDIFLDEITVSSPISARNKIDKYDQLQDQEIKFLLEYDYNVIPNLKRVKEKSPNTKITVLDSSDYLINHYDDLLGLGKQPITCRGMYPVLPRTWNNAILKSYNQLITKDNVCLITGAEKPILIFNGLELSFYFADCGICSKMMNNGIVDKMLHVEYFFWSGDYPLIPIKQSHILKKAFENNKSFYMKYWKTFQDDVIVDKTVEIQTSWLTFDREMANYIYPSIKLNFNAGKPLHLGEEFNLIRKYHGLKTRVDEKVLEGRNFIANKYKGVHPTILKKGVQSRGYYIGKFNPKWVQR